MTDRRATTRHGLLLPTALCALMALSACGRDPSAAADRAAQAEAARQPAELQVGDARIRASLVPSASLSPAIARRYGVEPHPRTLLLLVGVRTGPETDETSLPASVSATARDLRGVRQQIAMHEVRDGAFIDYAGAVQAIPPDTLAFEIVVTQDRAAPAALRFSRDVFP